MEQLNRRYNGVNMPEVRDEKPHTFSEHLLEVRYRPNPRILDYRGSWAETLSQYMELEDWQIVENRFDIFNKTRSRRGFVSFRNCGFYVQNSPTANYFPDQANKLLRFLFDQKKQFGDPIHVVRIGVRSRFATAYPGDFKALMERYSTRILSLSADATQAFDAKLIDIGGPLDFETRHGRINTLSGPMPREQLAEFFEDSTNLPEVAFFIDLDYSKQPDAMMDGKDVTAMVKRYAEENWERHIRVRSLVLDG